jgi:hypothetical protein
MAEFVIATGVSPSEYRKLTEVEYSAFANEVHRRAK